MPTGTEIKDSPKDMMFAVMVLDVDGTELVLGGTSNRARRVTSVGGSRQLGT